MNRALGTVVTLVKETVQEYQADEVPRMGASLAYYTVFSMAPVLVIAVGVAGLVFGREAASGQLQSELTGMMGEDAASVVSEAIGNAGKFDGGTVATVVGVVTLILGASGAFIEMQNALNRVWDAEDKAKKAGWMGFLRHRLVSFGMVLIIGFLLAVSTLLTVAISGFSKWASTGFEIPAWILEAANFGVSYLFIGALFAFMYKMLPDAKIQWRDVWVGASITGLLFVVGKSLIGLYIGKSSVGSTFGAAGSLVVVLVWVYYSSQILLFGAEFTQVWSRIHGSRSGQARKVAWNEKTAVEKRTAAASAGAPEDTRIAAAAVVPKRKARFRKIAGTVALAVVAVSGRARRR